MTLEWKKKLNINNRNVERVRIQRRTICFILSSSLYPSGEVLFSRLLVFCLVLLYKLTITIFQWNTFRLSVNISNRVELPQMLILMVIIINNYITVWVTRHACMMQVRVYRGFPVTCSHSRVHGRSSYGGLPAAVKIDSRSWAFHPCRRCRISHPLCFHPSSSGTY